MSVRSVQRWFIGIAFLGLAALLLSALRSERLARPNVLLVTIDTLRVDRLGCYGGSVRTPNIDSLAREGTLFDNVACPVPATRPSHFSLFTSRYPRELGVVSNELRLPAELPTLAEAFRDQGYSTAGFVGAKLLGPGSGAARGFDTFKFPRRRPQRDASAVVHGATLWLRRYRRPEPFFVWVHLFDPHMPYQPPPPFVPEGPVPQPDGLSGITWGRLLDLADEHEGDLPASILQRIEALYDGEVEETDMWVGVLLDALRSANKLDGTVVAFTADHGECFEHGIFVEHYPCLYEGAAHVPLIVRYPAKVAAGERRGEVAEHVDLGPTLLGLVGLSSPPTFAGVPLFATPAPHRKRFAALQHPVIPKEWIPGGTERRRRLHHVAGEPVRPLLLDGEQYGLRGEQWKYVVTGSVEELYDLSSDPTEARDVGTENPAVLAEMRRALQTWKDAYPASPAPPVPLSPGEEETLRALGYGP